MRKNFSRFTVDIARFSLFSISLCAAHFVSASSCYNVIIEDLNTQGVIDLYGVPGDLELSLKLELKQLQESVSEYESQGLRKLESYDQALTLNEVRVELPKQIPPEYAINVTSLIGVAEQATNSENLYLQLSLIERSEVFGYCMHSTGCHYDLSAKSREELKMARKTIAREMWVDKTGKWWTLPDDQLLNSLSEQEQLIIEKQILSLNNARDLMPLYYMAHVKYSGQSEPFWLTPHTLHQHSWYVYGRIESCQ